MTAQQRAAEFLRTCDQFQLGVLPTEQPHPKTQHLSTLAQTNVAEALSVLKVIDLEALRLLQVRVESIQQLSCQVNECFKAGGRVFLSGCGATGRLALSLEQIWRELHGAEDEQVVAFMAGGDVALVRAVEGFEDHPEYGARQLRELGFGENDLLIASTEGGETPFVIGTVESAASISRWPPCFLFCNPSEVLHRHVQRSRRVLDNNNICKIELSVGPMALTGSTRMQASTVLQLSIGLALFYPAEEIPMVLKDFLMHFNQQDVRLLQPFIEAESRIYHQNDHVIYFAHDFAITVFTDTTERAPTFSLPPFNNLLESESTHSLAYIVLPKVKTSAQAWHKLLGRPPKPLNWPQSPVTREQYLLGFDFSVSAVNHRQQLIAPREHFIFDIEKIDQSLVWRLGDNLKQFSLPGQHLLLQHIFLKLLLNMHSTIVMGRIGRYQNNLMTWVVPSNGKLIDRAARYIKHLSQQHGSDISYEAIIYALFQQMESWNGNESVVLKTLNHLAISTD